MKTSLSLVLPKLQNILSPVNGINLSKQNSESPKIFQKVIKKEASYQQSLLLSQQVSYNSDEEEIEVSLENTWQILLKDPQSRTDKQHDCVNEYVKELEMFKHYIGIVKKEIIKKISGKLIGYEFQKNQVVLSNEVLDNSYLFIILEGKVSIYDCNQASNGEQSKANFIKQYQKGYCINLNHIIFQRPFTDIAISDSHTLIAKLDKKIFRKYLLEIEEQAVEDEISFLQNIDLFSQLSLDEFQDLLLNMDIQTLSLNETLYNTFSKPDEFYIIKSGKIGIFKGRQVGQIQKELNFIDNEQIKIINIGIQEENIQTKNQINFQNTFQSGKPNFQSLLKSNYYTKIKELNTFDFLGYEEILSNTYRDHIAKSLQNNTILYVFRRSYFIKKLMKFKCFEKIIFKKRYSNKLESKKQQKLNIQFEQDLQLGLKFIENHSKPKSYLLQDLSLNNSALIDTTNTYERNQKNFNSLNNSQKQKQSFSLYCSQNQEECISPKKICIPIQNNQNRQVNVSNKKILIQQNYYLKNYSNSETKGNLQNIGFMMRQQDKINAYLYKQNLKEQSACLDMLTPRSDYSQNSARKLLIHNQVNQNDHEKQQNTQNQKNFAIIEESQARQRKQQNKNNLHKDQHNQLDSPLIYYSPLNQIQKTFLKTEQEYFNSNLQQKTKSEQSFLQQEQQRNCNSVLSSTKKINTHTNSRNIFSDPSPCLSQISLKDEITLQQKKKGSPEHLQTFGSQMIGINIDFIQQGLGSDKNSMLLSQLARIKQILEINYGSQVSELYAASQFQQKIIDGAILLNYKMFQPPSLNLNKFQSGKISPLESQLYSKNKLLFDFWYKQGQNDVSQLSSIAYKDYLQSSLTSMILRASSQSRKTDFSNRSYSQYILKSKLLKIIPPINDTEYLTSMVDECSGDVTFKGCQNQFSETYQQNSFWHTSPTEYELEKQFSNLCSITFGNQENVNNTHSILCQEIPLQILFSNFTSINQTSGLNIIVVDPSSQRQIYNNNKRILTPNDNFTSILQTEQISPQGIQSAESQYKQILQDFKLSENQSKDYYDIRSRGIQKTIDTLNGPKDFLLQMIVINFKEQKSKQTSYYNLYNVISWIDLNQLIEDSNKLKDDVNRFILVSYLVCAFVIFFILIISFLHAINIQILTEKPIEELTQILQNIRTDIFNETKETHNKEFNYELQQDLDQISESFSSCQELKCLFETFRQTFQTIQYANEAYFKGDQASSLLHWAQAVVFFENIKNYRAHGISLNNLGNIHLLELRYDEAIDCYEKSIEIINNEIKESYKQEFHKFEKKQQKQYEQEQDQEFNSFKDFNFIKLSRIIQYLHANIKKYKGALELVNKEQYKEFFDNKLQFYEKQIFEIIQILDIDLKRDCLCYVILCTCYFIDKNQEKTDQFLENIQNILIQMENTKQYQSEYNSCSPLKYQGMMTFTADQNNQSQLQTPLSQIDFKFNKNQRLTLFTQVSLNGVEEQHSSLIPPIKQSSSSITLNVNTFNNQKQHIYNILNEKKNQMNTKNKQKEENHLISNSFKTVFSYNKMQAQQKVLPQILSKRFKKPSLNKNLSYNSEIVEKIQKVEEQNQDQEEEEFSNGNCVSQIPSSEQTTIKNSFILNKINPKQNSLVSQKPLHLLEELTKNLPTVPSSNIIDNNFQECSFQKNNSKQFLRKNSLCNISNCQQINNQNNTNLSYLEPQNLQETLDQTHFSFYERQNKFINIQDQMYSINTELDQNNHSLHQARTPELPFIKQGTEETLKTIFELPNPQQITQIPDLTLQTTDRGSQEDNRIKLFTPLKIEKKMSSPRNSWKEDSPQIENRLKRIASQNIINRGKNLSIFNKPAQQKQESPYQNIPLEIFQQKFLLLKALLNNSKIQKTYEQVELITQIFENYQRYYLQDRLEALKFLSKTFNTKDQDLYLKDLYQKFQEAKWNLKIVIHEQFGDQSYYKVESCIKTVVGLIQKISPNKTNKYSIYINNDIQEELMSDSFGDINLNFLNDFELLLRKHFQTNTATQNSKNFYKESFQNDETPTQTFISQEDLYKKYSSQNANNQKKDLLKQHQFVIQAIEILRKYTDASLKKETKLVTVNNVFIKQFHSLTDQLNNPKFVNLFLVFWKLIFKFYGQNLCKIDDQKNDIEQIENIILSIHDAEDEKSIYDAIFILIRMKHFLIKLKIKVIIRIIIKQSYQIDLCTQNQIAKQAKKYVQLMQLNHLIQVISSSNHLNNFIQQIREPIRYLGNQLIIEKI
ncbi:PRP38 family protein (macronuclear) [Tetrahymena thermophila SB210]|uniref:PRP38 family protein n=1 Tax=Tetrahymena thermophila (strain SB210) TaxID=312017 RepID=I7MMJ7_TETTS|nr:PRP38 family protein [Tetrahymena thermophila SB210]EAS04989.2 PRP38 family protein [Tetrahymena thermophila SB210]|eukprot:XP_001025234.2 PRP38 family protein [Tetrahymena thermophila SB210]